MATLRARTLLADAQIPPRYEHCTFDNFELGEGASSTLREALMRARGFVENYPGFERSGLLFVGPAGTGKTHLACAIAHELIERRGIDCRFCDHRDLLKRIQATFDPSSAGTEAAVVGPLLRSEVLILDDLGVGRATDWALETLHYLINDRYSQNRATIITTNLEDQDAQNKSSLVQAVGERLRSRLCEMCRFVPMHGKDFRRAHMRPRDPGELR